MAPGPWGGRGIPPALLQACFCMEIGFIWSKQPDPVCQIPSEVGGPTPGTVAAPVQLDLKLEESHGSPCCACGADAQQ